jgi:hypothetical protein
MNDNFENSSQIVELVLDLSLRECGTQPEALLFLKSIDFFDHYLVIRIES